MTQPSRARRRTRRSGLESPLLAALIAIVLLLAGAIAVVQLGVLSPSAAPSAGTSGAAPTTAIATPTPEPTFVRPTPSPQPTFVVYRVQPGDTLNSIARQFRTTARSIAWWNRGAYPILDPESPTYDPNHLEVGWLLNVLPDSVVDETNPPTPSPGPPTASPGPVTAPPATVKPTSAVPTAVPAAVVISHGARTSTEIALTFDMGGRLTPAVDIVTWLIDHDVHATIFPTGYSGTQTDLGRAALQLAATRPDLFDFGNHSWDHPDFRDLTAAQMADQLSRTQAALLPLIGTTKPWFRPPYGGWNDTVRSGVGAAGWADMVLWDVDMIDWRPVSDGGPTAADMVAKLLAQARGGSIVLMHLGGYHTLEALPGVLAACEELALQPVTLTELLA